MNNSICVCDTNNKRVIRLKFRNNFYKMSFKTVAIVQARWDSRFQEKF